MRFCQLSLAGSIAGVLIVTACAERTEVAAPAAMLDAAATLTAPPQAICGIATVAPLIAAGAKDAGSVTVANDGTYLYVTFRTDAAWPIAKTAVFAGSDAAEIPVSGGGNPIIGRFKSSRHRNGTHEVTRQIPLEEVNGANAIVAAFAEVGGNAEGAWAAGAMINPSAGWATYMTHAVQECANATVGSNGATIVSNLGNVILEIPALALDSDVEITIEPDASTNAQVLPGTVFDFGPDGLEFEVPASLTLKYDPLLLPPGVTEDRIRPAQIINGIYVTVGSYEHDASANAITFPVEHFSLYGLVFVDFVDLAVANVTLTPNPARVTDAVSLFAEIRNTGLFANTASASEVAVTLLDPLFIVESATPGCSTIGEIVADGVRFKCTVGPLAPGESTPILFALRPQIAAANRTGTIRVAVAPALTAGVEDPSASNDAVDVEFEIQPESFADLHVTNVSSSPATPVKAGRPVVLQAGAESKAVAGADPVQTTISFQAATGAASLDILHDDLPAGCSGTSTVNFTTINCDAGLLHPGTFASVGVPVRPRTAGPFSFTVTVHPTLGDPTPGDNVTSLSFEAEPLHVDLAIIDLDESLDELNVGETLIYSVRVQSLASSQDAPVGAVLRMEVTGDAAFDNATAQCVDVSGSVGGASVAINCPLAELAPGETSEQFNLVLHPTAASQILEATARLLLPGWHDDPDLTNNSATETTRVRSSNEVDFQLRDFAASAGVVKAFEALTYSADVVLASTSAGATTGGEYRLEIIGDVEVTSLSDPGCTTSPILIFDGVRVSCPLGTYAGAGSKTFTAEVRGIEAPQTLNATATIIPPTDVTEIAPGNEEDTASTDVQILGNNLFLTTVSAAPDPVAAGGTVQYGVYAMSSGTGDGMPRVVVQFRVDGDAQLVSMPTGLGVNCADLSAGNLLAVVVNCDVEPLQAGIASPQLLLDVQAVSGPALDVEVEIFAISAYAEDTDPSDNVQSTTTSVGAAPSDAVVYVAVAGDDKVVAIDPSTNTVIATIPVGDGPRGLRVTPDGSEVWVLNRISENISIISTATHTVTTISRSVIHPSVIGDLYDIDFTPDGARAYITVNESGGNQRVLVMNVAPRTEVTNIFLANELPGAIRILPDGSKAYLKTSGAIVVLDLASNTVATTIAAAGTHGLTVAGDGSAVYFGQDNASGGLLLEIDPTTDAVVGAGIGVGTALRGVAVNSANTHAFVADERGGVNVVDLGTRTVTTIPVTLGTLPYELAITPDDASLFVGFRSAGQLAKIDIATASIVSTTAIGSFPGAVVVRD